MKRNKTIYWTATILAMLLGAASAPFYFSAPAMIEGFRHLGFPDYFRYELATGKIAGALIILLPMSPARVKEWAYVAFGIVFISATIAHGAVDNMGKAAFPIVAFIFLSFSYTYYHKLNKAKLQAA